MFIHEASKTEKKTGSNRIVEFTRTVLLTSNAYLCLITRFKNGNYGNSSSETKSDPSTPISDEILRIELLLFAYYFTQFKTRNRFLSQRKYYK